MLKIILASFSVIAATTFGVKEYEESKLLNELKEVKTANAILEKKEHIKDIAALNDIELASGKTSKITEIGKGNINNILLPSKDLGFGQKLLLSKYEIAVEKYFKLHNPSLNPTCVQLSSLSLIELEECDKVVAYDMETFNYDNGVVSYATDSNVATKIQMIRKSNQTVHGTDSNTGKVSFIDTNVKISKFQNDADKSSARKEKRLIALINKNIQSNPDSAARFASNLAELSPFKALSISSAILKTVEQNNVSELKKNEVAKYLSRIALKNKLIYHKNYNLLNLNSDENNIKSAIDQIASFSGERLTEEEKNFQTLIENEENQTSTIYKELNTLQWGD